MSLETIESKLANWVAENRKAAPQQPEQPKAEEQPVVEPPEVKEEPKKEEEPVKQEEAKAEPQLSWDEDTEITKKDEPKVDYDFSELGSALELEGVKTKEEFLSKASELKTKLKTLEQNPLAGIPDDFKEVIEVSKSGVDWRGYLADQLIDYSKLDGDQLIHMFEDDFIKRAETNPKFFTDGKFDMNKVEEVLDAMPEAVREMYGRQMAQAKAQEQRTRQLQLKAQAEAKLQHAEKSLGEATRNLNELLPFENYGIKFDPKHSSEIYNGITSSKLTKELLGVSYEDLVKSGADMKVVAKTIAAAKYAEKMIKFKSQNAKVEGKKEVLDKIRNPQIKSSGSVVQPESETKKEMSAAEKLAYHLKNVKKNGLS